MAATFVTRISEGSSSTAEPVWTKSTTLAVNQAAVRSTSVLIFTDLLHDHSSAASGTNHDQAQSSKTPVSVQTLAVNSSTLSSDSQHLTADHLQLQNVVEKSSEESQTSSTQNVLLAGGAASGSTGETTTKTTTTLKTETEDSSLPLNSSYITTAMPLKSHTVVHSEQPPGFSEMRTSNDVQKTTVLRHTDAVTRDVVGASTSYKPSVQFSEAARLSVSTVLHNTARIRHESTAEAAHSRFQTVRSQPAAVQETTSQSSSASSSEHVNEYISATYHAGVYWYFVRFIELLHVLCINIHSSSNNRGLKLIMLILMH